MRQPTAPQAVNPKHQQQTNDPNTTSAIYTEMKRKKTSRQLNGEASAAAQTIECHGSARAGLRTLDTMREEGRKKAQVRLVQRRYCRPRAWLLGEGAKGLDWRGTHVCVGFWKP